MSSPISTMPAAYAAKQALIEELLSPSQFTINLDGQAFQQTIVADPFFHSLKEVEDIEVAHIPGPIGHSVLLVRGRQGAHQKRVEMHQAVCIHVLAGQLLLWLPGQHDQEPCVLREGERVELPAGLTHGFVVAVDCLLYNVYTPAFDLLLTPISSTP